MARGKRHTPEQVVNVLCQIEVAIAKTVMATLISPQQTSICTVEWANICLLF